MDSDDLLKRVRAIPGVLVATFMHGRQCDRLFVKVASGDANPVNRRVHPLLQQYPDLGLLYEYVAGPSDPPRDSLTQPSMPPPPGSKRHALPG